MLMMGPSWVCDVNRLSPAREPAEPPDRKHDRPGYIARGAKWLEEDRHVLKLARKGRRVQKPVQRMPRPPPGEAEVPRPWGCASADAAATCPRGHQRVALMIQGRLMSSSAANGLASTAHDALMSGRTGQNLRHGITQQPMRGHFHSTEPHCCQRAAASWTGRAAQPPVKALPDTMPSCQAARARN